MIRIGRRHFLTGAGGVLVGLPLLEGLAPRVAKAAAGPTFLFAYAQPYGVFQDLQGTGDNFWPNIPTNNGVAALDASNLGAALSAGRSTGALAEIAQHIAIVKGVNNLDNSDLSWHHEGGYCQTLTGSAIDHRTGDHQKMLTLSEDIAYRAAREFAAGTPSSPLPFNVFSSSGGYNLAPWGAPPERVGSGYQGGLTYDDYMRNPKEVYRKIYGISRPAEEIALQQSVNSLVKSDLDALKRSARLSKEDRVRLDNHMEAIRSVESRIACSAGLPNEHPVKRSVDECELKEDRGGTNDKRYESGFYFQETADTMLELCLLAVACGTTRVVRFWSKGNVIGAYTDMFEPSSGDYRKLMDKEMHEYTHQLGGVWQERLRQHDRWHLKRLVRIVNGLKEHNLLDNGTVLFHSEQKNGDHRMDNLPFILAGNCGGALKMGQLVEANTKTNRFLATVGAALGLKDDNKPITQFGGKYPNGTTEPGGYIDALKGASFPT